MASRSGCCEGDVCLVRTGLRCTSRLGVASELSSYVSCMFCLAYLQHRPIQDLSWSIGRGTIMTQCLSLNKRDAQRDIRMRCL